MSSSPILSQIIKQHGTSFGIGAIGAGLLAPMLLTKYMMASNQPWLWAKSSENTMSASSSGAEMAKAPMMTAEELENMVHGEMLLVYD
ncbi:DEKNAAC100049 [Brettanomyces naardenensis]|uniref:DEKNAAC100049 n=1 Tax=Brettanomyces naardenensis TaxID=13370 RepID=A0A448YGF1_BRENA|nr:DEKNAAC100049 [Brettanomyces naardenensis]